MARASIEVHSAETTVISLVCDTLHAIGMSDKEACLHMGFDASQFSRVKRGEARIPLEALWRLPDHFWLEFRRRVDAAKRLTAENERAVRAARIGELVRLLVEMSA